MSSDMWGAAEARPAQLAVLGRSWAGGVSPHLSLPAPPLLPTPPLPVFFPQIPKFPIFPPFYIPISFLTATVNIYGALIG